MQSIGDRQVWFDLPRITAIDHDLIVAGAAARQSELRFFRGDSSTIAEKRPLHGVAQRIGGEPGNSDAGRQGNCALVGKRGSKAIPGSILGRENAIEKRSEMQIVIAMHPAAV